MVGVRADDEAGLISCDPSAESIAFREPRHQTKNALQRILLQAIFGALFGFTARRMLYPSGLERRVSAAPGG